MVCPAYARDAAGHNLQLEMLLFGPNNAVTGMSPEAQNALKALEYAPYLALDQYSGKGSRALAYLNGTYHVPGLPKSIDAIDFPGNEHHLTYVILEACEKNTAALYKEPSGDD